MTEHPIPGKLYYLQNIQKNHITKETLMFIKKTVKIEGQDYLYAPNTHNIVTSVPNIVTTYWVLYLDSRNNPKIGKIETNDFRFRFIEIQDKSNIVIRTQEQEVKT